MPTIQEQQQAIVEQFAQLPDWDARYKYIIDLGKQLPGVEDAHKTDDNIVRGCQSQVWMVADESDGKVIFKADSDALIVRGLIALIVQVYSGQSPEDILAHPPEFINQIDMGKHLSMQRSNGLAAMVKQIQMYALGYKVKLAQQA
jgi:cysteine desulfuration protein SufE